MVKKLKKILLLVITAFVLFAGSGFFVSYHHCPDCGSSDIAFFKLADCSCEAHHSHQIQNDDNCCSTACHHTNSQCAHHCITIGKLFSMPFFPLQKTDIPPIADLITLFAFHSLYIHSHTETEMEITPSISDPPPLIIKTIDFICFSQQRVFYS